MFSWIAPVSDWTATVFDGQRPCLIGQRPCVIGQRPCLMGERPCLMGERTNSVGKCPCLIGERPCWMGEFRRCLWRANLVRLLDPDGALTPPAELLGRLSRQGLRRGERREGEELEARVKAPPDAPERVPAPRRHLELVVPQLGGDRGGSACRLRSEV